MEGLIFGILQYDIVNKDLALGKMLGKLPVRVLFTANGKRQIQVA